ncbi:MAG: gamma-glutamylcyclotransferase [Bacteroidota bacterium]|nr:gamma-glutamylcyclotransferase [Bacteroidota bacterium]
METPSSLQLFVYSSLRKGFHLEAYEYLAKYFTFAGMGKVKGTLRDSGTEPVATPTEEDTFIKGELYSLNKKDDFSWVFGQLDEYEGLDAAQGEKILYKRELTKVYKDDGSVTDAWIFWFDGDVSGKPVINSEDVLEYLKSKKL